MKSRLIFLPLIFATFSCGSEKEQTSERDAINANFLELGVMCGTVQFEDGCSPRIDSLIQFGLALVHHMTFDDAEYNFNKVIEMDPDCFWGHWGKALTYIHPLWPDEPSKSQLNRGLVLSQRALSLAQKEKEKHYGQALAEYYKNGLEKTEKDRLSAYENGWKKVHQQFPDDLEAELFYGLSRLSTASPSDKSYSVQKEVGSMAERTLQVIPDHPGGFHYAIHAYDFPPLANQAIRVAQNYSKIAPEIPHALHMPTHIFTRLGYWKESIDGNTKSAAVAKKLPVDGQISLHYVHALDYLVYAYLQQSQNEKADSIFSGIRTLVPPFQNSGVVAYALAAIPARIALETQDWERASNLELPHIDNFPWENFPQFSSICYFARGVGAARNGNLEVTQRAYELLDSLHLSMGNAPEKAYWSKQVEIQKTAVKAWHSYMGGNQEEGLAILNEAAKMEDGTTKSPVTPGELLPMREMLGDLYLDQGKYKLALENYQKSLMRNPNRFNTIYGAAKAAEHLNKIAVAKDYYRDLLELGAETDPTRSQIRYASKFVNG